MECLAVEVRYNLVAASENVLQLQKNGELGCHGIVAANAEVAHVSETGIFQQRIDSVGAAE